MIESATTDSAQATMEQPDDKAKAALLRRFEAEQTPPESIKTMLAAMDADRQYVHTDANLPTDPGGVSTNYIWRAQQVHQAKIYAKNPSASVKAKKKIGQIPQAITDAMEGFGETMEMLIQGQSDEAGMRDVLEGVVQDVDTVGLMFVKLTFVESEGRDPAGVTRPQDATQTMASYRQLHADFAAGKFTDQDEQYRKMAVLGDNIKKQQEGELWRQMAFGDGALPPTDDPRKVRWQGLPTPQQLIELPKFRGFVVDPLDPEDVRWDWIIKRPELMHRGRRMEYRTFMTPEKIRADYNIAPDDDRYFTSGNSVSTDTSAKATTEENKEQGKAAIDATERHGTVAVWVREDRELNKIITWVHGAALPLAEETPEATSRDWFTIYPVYFNRVTGRVLPVSNVTLGRDLQDEINLVRTHKRQAKRAAYNRYLVEQGLLDEKEMDELRKCPPEGWVMTKNKIDDIRKKLYQVNGSFNPAVHDVLEERQELGAILGQSQATQGMTKGGADSATEASIANQTGELMDDKHRGALERLLQRLYTAMGDILVQVLPEENVKAMVGPGAVWPLADKIAIWNHLQVEIEAGSTGKPDQQKERDAFEQSISVGTAAGLGKDPMGPQWNLPWLLKKLAAINNWREDVEQMLIMPPPPMLPPMPPPGQMLPGAPAAGGGPPQAPHPEIVGEGGDPGARAPENLPDPHMAINAPSPEMIGAGAG